MQPSPGNGTKPENRRDLFQNSHTTAGASPLKSFANIILYSTRHVIIICRYIIHTLVCVHANNPRELVFAVPDTCIIYQIPTLRARDNNNNNNNMIIILLGLPAWRRGVVVLEHHDPHRIVNRNEISKPHAWRTYNLLLHAYRYVCIWTATEEWLVSATECRVTVINYYYI